MATSAVHDVYETTHTANERVSPSWKDGKVLFSTDMGANWQIMGNFETPVIWVETGPTNDEVLYASVVSPDSMGGLWKAINISNPANDLGHLWRTTDRGDNREPITAYTISSNLFGSGRY